MRARGNLACSHKRKHYTGAIVRAVAAESIAQGEFLTTSTFAADVSRSPNREGVWREGRKGREGGRRQKRRMTAARRLYLAAGCADETPSAGRYQALLVGLSEQVTREQP